ncbi:hypothetical protein OG455_14370 [Kitasatospora sp. NBC_01287]|uniref:hypothetical protein n=1 Tax=Kitasatospora sp. NBC_01287 TaxID=2903573 RepID=UPI00225BF4F0|nr:hypothetical protein [Kitasatospora sp. NBC_01287]MCX4746689.1 hypothetical protein [Kitasatospora sp. NBC_01287]
MDDILRDLQHLNTHLAGLRSALAATQEALPRRAEGTDRSKTVTVLIGPDDLPLSIEVGPDWSRRLRPAELGGAVVEAGQRAVVQRLAGWQEEAGRAAWQAVPSELPDGGGPVAEPPVAEAPPADLTALLGDLSQVAPRPLEELVEDVLDSLDQAAAPPAPVEGRGSDQAGRLTLVLSPGGLTACELDESWAAERSSAELNRALARALAQAHSGLADALRAARDRTATGPDALLREALALLSDPRRLADS